MFTWLSKCYNSQEEENYSTYNLRFQGNEYIFYGRMIVQGIHCLVNLNVSTNAVDISKINKDQVEPFDINNNIDRNSNVDFEICSPPKMYINQIIVFCAKYILRALHSDLYKQLPCDLQDISSLKHIESKELLSQFYKICNNILFHDVDTVYNCIGRSLTNADSTLVSLLKIKKSFNLIPVKFIN